MGRMPPTMKSASPGRRRHSSKRIGGRWKNSGASVPVAVLEAVPELEHADGHEVREEHVAEPEVEAPKRDLHRALALSVGGDEVARDEDEEAHRQHAVDAHERAVAEEVLDPQVHHPEAPEVGNDEVALLSEEHADGVEGRDGDGAEEEEIMAPFQLGTAPSPRATGGSNRRCPTRTGSCSRQSPR